MTGLLAYPVLAIAAAIVGVVVDAVWPGLLDALLGGESA